MFLSGWAVALTGYFQRRTSYLPLLIPLVPSLLALSTYPLMPLALPYVNPSGLLRVLSSTPSVTGRIVVAEDYKHGFRFLRADHSLLGGVWIGNKAVLKDRDSVMVVAQDGANIGDSIYSAFVLQEAARLQEREGSQKNALIMYVVISMRSLVSVTLVPAVSGRALLLRRSCATAWRLR